VGKREGGPHRRTSDCCEPNERADPFGGATHYLVATTANQDDPTRLPPGSRRAPCRRPVSFTYGIRTAPRSRSDCRCRRVMVTVRRDRPSTACARVRNRVQPSAETGTRPWRIR